MPAASRRQSSLDTESSSSMVRPSTASPLVSIAPGAGSMPIGDSVAAPAPFARATIQRSTRMFSPKPGQMNRPSASWRNQLTWKMAGGRLTAFPISSQWPK